MRFHIIFATLLLILIFAGVLERRYEWIQKPKLLAQAERSLAHAHLDGIKITLDHFDARLDGTCNDPDGREKAVAIVDKLPGLRVLEWNNHVRVPAKVVHKIKDNTITLSGWLPNEDDHAELVQRVKEYRPELSIDDKGIRTSPHVDLGKMSKSDEGLVPQVFINVLEKIRVPPYFAIERDGPAILVHGRVQSETLAQEITTAAAGSINGRRVTLDLTANKHTPTATFTQGSALAKFTASFLDSPSPGTFSINILNGPKLKAYATATMESEWLALLRPVSGPARVDADITRVPSIYHFPDYQPLSPLPPEMINDLRAVFKTQIIYFDPGSAILRPEEALKLGPLVYLINNAGPAASYLIAASADSSGEPGTANQALHRARGDAVRNKLAQLGVTNTNFEVLACDALINAQLPPDQARRQTRSVELILK